jgi:hypothetical protein
MTSIRIEIKGILEKHWKESFASMAFSYKGDNTILTGCVPDQSAFHGLLNMIRDLNLTLVSITSEI